MHNRQFNKQKQNAAHKINLSRNAQYKKPTPLPFFHHDNLKQNKEIYDNPAHQWNSLEKLVFILRCLYIMDKFSDNHSQALSKDGVLLAMNAPHQNTHGNVSHHHQQHVDTTVKAPLSLATSSTLPVLPENYLFSCNAFENTCVSNEGAKLSPRNK